MSLLSLRFQPALLVLIPLAVIMLLATPVTWSVRAPWNAIGPVLVWASGSPDETLSPPPTPKKSARVVIRPEGASDRLESAVSKMDTLSNAVSTRYFLYVLWRVYLATAVRF